MGLKFFHLPKPRHFHIDYRYYDPKKEEREKRERKIKAEMGLLNEEETKRDFRSEIKGSFRSGRLGNSSSFAHRERRKSNLRLAIIIVLLITLLYFFFLK